MGFKDILSFDERGLIPAIAQDKETGRILMVAWMNHEALTKTIQTKQAVYFSRSRCKLWHKGEESGHVQHVHEIRTDCDGDVILLTVTQEQQIACHTGRTSCFYKRLDWETQTWEAVDPVMKDPKDIYHHE
ncbi:phosphoribosyl-AMP cyclohydrolase [Basilea psittacipulmonis]|uniref:Phosphoribosyl-AMP cyclohydrolase n=1 Tax=Basilea psittacipulmonis DSM 24701 TaxID=1072685 RepID=A0A077DGQ8_9BURK|nr:phosphoribosyl-AMP cyclohydrolase [Basilea psittacipulmonis]AIL33316.1 phosphoribosyl-AMP cyclohydrolase [Basilea psittacipulmonis DSM 24701]